MERVEHQVGQAQRGEVAQHDRRHQVQPDARPAQEQDQDGVDPERDEHVHPPLVAGGHPAEVVDHRGRARQADGPGPFQGLSRRPRLPDDLADPLEGIEAGLGEGIRLEDDVEPRDVTDIGRVGRLDADVSGLGRALRRAVGELGQEALVRPAERLADRLGERADLGHRSIACEPPADLRDRGPALAPNGSPAGIVDQGRGRAELAHGEVAPDDLGADHARAVGVEVGELVVVRPGPGAHDRQGEQGHQADRQDRHRVPDDQVGGVHPEPRDRHLVGLPERGGVGGRPRLRGTARRSRCGARPAARARASRRPPARPPGSARSPARCT